MICKFIEDLNTMAEYNLINGNELVGQIALSPLPQDYVLWFEVFTNHKIIFKNSTFVL